MIADRLDSFWLYVLFESSNCTLESRRLDSSVERDKDVVKAFAANNTS